MLRDVERGAVIFQSTHLATLHFAIALHPAQRARRSSRALRRRLEEHVARPPALSRRATAPGHVPPAVGFYRARQEENMPEPGRGVYGILLTSYTDRDEVDRPDLASQADFVASTAQGIVWPVLASEFYLMADDERPAGYAAVAEGARGRVPFVAGVSATTTRAAASLAEAAARAGADAVIAMAPYMKRAVGEQLVAHFEAIAGAGRPIFVQNAAYLTGACTLSPDDLRMLTDRVPLVQYLKEEAPVLPQTVSNILKKVPGRFKGVFGGGGSRYLLDELSRGGAGNMPGLRVGGRVRPRLRAVRARRGAPRRGGSTPPRWPATTSRPPTGWSARARCSSAGASCARPAAATRPAPSSTPTRWPRSRRRSSCSGPYLRWPAAGQRPTG